LNYDSDSFIASLPGKDAWAGEHVQMLCQGCRLNRETGEPFFVRGTIKALKNFYFVYKI
jgi:5-methylcytosine-specific restriction endonuclease McrA